MIKYRIPNFLFYSNLDSTSILKECFSKMQHNKNSITDIKNQINSILNITNFTLIYFYIGNFFIKNKLKKSLKNLILIKNGYYIISNTNLNFNVNFKNFFFNLDKLKQYNLKKVILFFNNNYYRPLDLVKLPYFYFLFFTTFLLNFKVTLFYLNINILNSFYILQKKLKIEC